MAHAPQLVVSIRRPHFRNRGAEASGRCLACGQQANFGYADVIAPELAAEWGIDDKLRRAYSERESRTCDQCSSSLRSRTLAGAIRDVFAPTAGSLKDLVASEHGRKLVVAEINACGQLHQFLKDLPHNHYSEYQPKDKDVRHEDLTALSYPDNYFDAAVSSDTLEHIPRPEKAFAEIRRVLKPGGYHIFTVPVIFSRKTRRRINVGAKGKIDDVLPRSYHGSGEPDNLVCTEFGRDILRQLKAAGFRTRIYYANPLNSNAVNCVFICRKV